MLASFLQVLESFVEVLATFGEFRGVLANLSDCWRFFEDLFPISCKFSRVLASFC